MASNKTYITYLFYFLTIGNAVSLVFLNKHFFNGSRKKGFLISESRRVSIAICHPASSSTVDATIQGFKDELAQDPGLECFYTMYNNSSDPATLDYYAQEIVNSKSFDLVFTVGHGTSIRTAELMRRKGSHTPMVFAAVINPVEAGVVPKDRDRTCFITGSSCEDVDHHNEKWLELLLLLKPDVKRLIIPYDFSCDAIFKRMVIETEREALGRNISVKKIAVSSVMECVHAVKDVVQEGDVILVTRDAMVMAATPDLAQLAAHRGAMVYASSSGAIEHGAAFGFGSDDKTHVINAGRKARSILARNNHPADIPITPAPYEPYLWINHQAIKSPKLKIDPLVIRVLESMRMPTGNGRL